MANSVYQINKGINASIEFKGLKAQYIWYLGGAIAALLILFSVMYILGVPSLICVGVALAAGTFSVLRMYKLSNTYGEHGLMKVFARRQVPKVITSKSRQVFLFKK